MHLDCLVKMAASAHCRAKNRIVSRILIDVTRLVHRRMAGRLPTGVDRVSLAYLRHFMGDARAVLTAGGRSSVLPLARSTPVFEALLDGKRQDAPMALRTMLGAVSR